MLAFEAEATDLRFRCRSRRDCLDRYDNPDLECDHLAAGRGRCRERRCRSNMGCPQGAACVEGACVDVAKARYVSKSYVGEQKSDIWLQGGGGGHRT